MKKSRFRGRSFLVVLALLVLWFTLFPEQDVFAENRILEGGIYREISGSYYWPTSNIREWLNSDQPRVQFTNQPPTSAVVGKYAYDEEPGFLYEFTEEEKAAIAVTKRKTFVLDVDAEYRDGGTMMFRHSTVYASKLINHYIRGIETDWKNYYYKVVYDKVFLLGPHELYHYVQKRGMDLVKRYIGTGYPIAWAVSEGRKDPVLGEHILAVQQNGEFRSWVNAKDPLGIVPALHIKPNYQFADGRFARDLSIGDIVSFGRYKGQPITWVVINKTQDGYALLWSVYALTIKPFDAPGDSYSWEYPQNWPYNTFDVDITTDLQYFNNSTDHEPPVLRVLNPSEMDIRQNSSFNLHIQAYDGETGVDRIILPDGTSVNTDTVTIPITENKVYYLAAVDKAGNYGYLALPIGNINPEPQVIVQPSTTEWTNKDVTVDIFASNDVGYEAARVRVANRYNDQPQWPNFTTYIGKRIRISGCAELVDAKMDPGNIEFRVGVYYWYRQNIGSSYWYMDTRPYPWGVKLKDIYHNKQCFDFVYQLGGNYFATLKPSFFIDVPYYLNGTFTVELTNVKYELLDKEDFEIEKIILPSGTEVYAKSYRDVLTKTGVYEYTIIDNRNYVTRKQVNVKIDKVAPILNVVGDTATITPGPVILQVEAADDASGLRWVQTPDGQMTSQAKFSYAITKNGTYSFVAEDVAGNRTMRTVVVNNINAPPKAQFSWTPLEPVVGDTVQFNGQASDPDGHAVTLEWAYLKPSATDWTVFSNIANPTLVVDEPGTWWVRLTASDPYGFQDTVLHAINVDPKVVATCIPLENPVWTVPNGAVTIACRDETIGGKVVAGLVTVNGESFPLSLQNDRIWSSLVQVDAAPGVYPITLTLQVQDSKGRTSNHFVTLTLVVSPMPLSPRQGIEILEPLPGLPGKVKLIG